METPPEPPREGLVVCREGLEKIVARELKLLGIEVLGLGTRAVHFRTDKAGIYRANMGLRSGLNVVLPLRTFNARNYEMLYFQARKTNWHKLFPVDATLRIDVNGGSSDLRHSQYVVHRVKDGIVDTFRKLSGGRRPSIRKDDPDVHIVVHLSGNKVTLGIDTSGVALFKRGYRLAHGEAPLKEDLAAGMLQLSGWDRASALVDPMCGSGTFLFEGWMLAANIAPNLNRRFGFEALLDYDPALHAAERQRLIDAQITPPPDFRITGIEKDAETAAIARTILCDSFADAPVRIDNADFRDVPPPANAFFITNPPYGKRIGEAESIAPLYRQLARFLSSAPTARGNAVYTANLEAAHAAFPEPTRELTLYNGQLEGRLLVYPAIFPSTTLTAAPPSE